MLHAGSDDVIPLSEDAENGDVERLGAVFGENHPFEAPAVEIVGERASAVLDDGGAGKGELMKSRLKILRNYVFLPCSLYVIIIKVCLIHFREIRCPDSLMQLYPLDQKE